MELYAERLGLHSTSAYLSKEMRVMSNTVVMFPHKEPSYRDLTVDELGSLYRLPMHEDQLDYMDKETLSDLLQRQLVAYDPETLIWRRTPDADRALASYELRYPHSYIPIRECDECSARKADEAVEWWTASIGRRVRAVYEAIRFKR